MTSFTKWLNEKKGKNLGINILAIMYEHKIFEKVALALLEYVYQKSAGKSEKTVTIEEMAQKVMEKVSTVNKNNRDRLNIAIEFIHNLKSQIETDINEFAFLNVYYEKELIRLNRSEKTLFNFYVIIIGLTIIVGVAGIALILLGLRTVGLITVILDILPASTSVLINKAYHHLRSGKSDTLTKIHKLKDDSHQEHNVLKAINRAICIDDSQKRNDAILKLTETLSQQKINIESST